jgi:hypothetical protein
VKPLPVFRFVLLNLRVQFCFTSKANIYFFREACCCLRPPRKLQCRTDLSSLALVPAAIGPGINDGISPGSKS